MIVPLQDLTYYIDNWEVSQLYCAKSCTLILILLIYILLFYLIYLLLFFSTNKKSTESQRQALPVTPTNYTISYYIQVITIS